jgi:hypothetical protein
VLVLASWKVAYEVSHQGLLLYGEQCTTTGSLIIKAFGGKIILQSLPIASSLVFFTGLFPNGKVVVTNQPHWMDHISENFFRGLNVGRKECLPSYPLGDFFPVQHLNSSSRTGFMMLPMKFDRSMPQSSACVELWGSSQTMYTGHSPSC